MNKYLIITRKDRIDGIVAGALAMVAIKDIYNPHCNLSFFFASNSSFQKKIKKISQEARTYNGIVILDLKVTQNLGEYFQKIQEKNTRITLVGHEQETDKNREKLEKYFHRYFSYGAKEKTCTSSMMYSIFFPLYAIWSTRPKASYNHLSYWAKIAQADDYPQTNTDMEYQEIIMILQKIINFANYTQDEKLLQRLVDDIYLGENPIDQAYTQTIAKKHDRIYKEKFDEFLKTIKTSEIKGRKFVHGFADGILNPEEILYHLAFEYYDEGYSGFYVVCGHPVNKAFFLSEVESDFNTAKFCIQMKGTEKNDIGNFPIQKANPQSHKEINKQLKKFLS